MAQSSQKMRIAVQQRLDMPLVDFLVTVLQKWRHVAVNPLVQEMTMLTGKRARSGLGNQLCYELADALYAYERLATNATPTRERAAFTAFHNQLASRLPLYMFATSLLRTNERLTAACLEALVPKEVRHLILCYSPQTVALQVTSIAAFAVDFVPKWSCAAHSGDLRLAYAEAV